MATLIIGLIRMSIALIRLAIVLCVAMVTVAYKLVKLVVCGIAGGIGLIVEKIRQKECRC